MADNTPRASQEELSAVVAIVAVLAAAEGADDPDRAHRPSAESQKPSRSPWNAPSRMVRQAYPHGPGGWRASASPR